jgi:pimeloyl-ACP methyl ester carboxylesterase
VTAAGRTWVLAVLLLAGGGCAALGQGDTPAIAAVACRSCRQGVRGVVYVADGAGNFQAASTSLERTILEQGTPVCVERFEWSHGYGRILSDHLGLRHARAEGARLAAEVRAFNEQSPQTPVFLLGHSAGCEVVLAAAEALPPGSVEDVVLLAPAVSSHYDLRPALAASRRGVDSFYSPNDWVYLGVGVAVLGTTDRHWAAPAGRVGFRPVGASPEDGALYDKLREYPWDPQQSWTGNFGGHYGGYQPGFLRASVVPLLAP